MLTRRRFLQGLGALAVSPDVLASFPFSLGVASGYPAPDGVVLWTRLTGVLAPVSVQWEVAADEAMKSIVLAGETAADPAWAHSVHVDVKGLAPAIFDLFGYAIAISADSTRIVSAAFFDDGITGDPATKTSVNSGAVYVFE